MGWIKKTWRQARGKSGGYRSAEDVRQMRTDLLAEYDARVNGFDQWGFPMGDEPPPAEIAMYAQQRADRIAYERNRGLEDSAAMAVRNAQGLLEGYRPGGSAAMAAGIHSQLADVYLNSRAEAPYLMADYEREQAFKARKAARKARELQFGASLVMAAATVAAPMLAPALPGVVAGLNTGAGGEYVPPGGQTLGGQPLTSTANAGAPPISTVPPGYQGVDPGVPMPPGGIAPAQMGQPGMPGGGSPWTPQQVQRFQQGFNRDMGGSRGVGQSSLGGPGGPGGPSGGAGGGGPQASGGQGGAGGGMGQGGGGGVPYATQALATHLYAEWLDAGSDFYRAMGSRLNRFGWSAA